MHLHDSPKNDFFPICARLERLQRLAEKCQRDVRFNEETLVDLGRRIDDTAQGLDVMHTFEAKRNADALDRGLKSVEEAVRGLFHDCQALQDASHPQAEQLYRRSGWFYLICYWRFSFQHFNIDETRVSIF